MFTYTVEYDLVSETVPLVHLSDTVTTEFPLPASELAVRLSLRWALVRGETNDLTNLVVIRETESV